MKESEKHVKPEIEQCVIKDFRKVTWEKVA